MTLQLFLPLKNTWECHSWWVSIAVREMPVVIHCWVCLLNMYDFQVAFPSLLCIHCAFFFLCSGLYCGIWLWCSPWWWVNNPSWGYHQEREKTGRRRMVGRGVKWQKGHVPWQFCEGEFSAFTWFYCDGVAGSLLLKYLEYTTVLFVTGYLF